MQLGNYNIKCVCGNLYDFEVVENVYRKGIDIHCKICGKNEFLFGYIIINKDTWDMNVIQGKK